mmetsp:Transcript_20422/g.51089  ORF Transcript_20422/g.51089 Transcript_20422/m.51089 type:complete len:91 (+) Transcript_20422:798-1070(+)
MRDSPSPALCPRFCRRIERGWRFCATYRLSTPLASPLPRTQGNPTLIAHEAETGAAAELLHALGPTPELAAYVKRRKNGKYETCCTGLIN